MHFRARGVALESAGGRGRALITVDTAVAGLEVSDDVLRAGLLLVQSGIGQLDHTRRSARAAGVEQRQHVGGAADVDVGVDAAPESHSTESCRLHHDHVTERTAGVERFPLAVVVHERRHTASGAASRSLCQHETCQADSFIPSPLQYCVRWGVKLYSLTHCNEGWDQKNRAEWASRTHGDAENARYENAGKKILLSVVLYAERASLLLKWLNCWTVWTVM